MTYDFKTALREAMLGARNSIPKHLLESMSEAVQENVLKTDEFAGAGVVGAYHPIGSEVSTLNLLASTFRMGKRLALPRVEAGDGMVFAEVRDLNNDLRAGAYKVMEPGAHCMRVDDLDILLLPGVAWDVQGYRLGYGKGYYDRYLASTRTGVTKVGLAYDIQILESVPHNSNDIRVDMMVTEKRIIRAEK